MKFRTKLIFCFSFIAFLLSSALGMVHYKYASQGLIESVEKNLQMIAEQMCIRLDEVLCSMDNAGLAMLSDNDVLDAIQLIPRLHERQDNQRIKESVEFIQERIATAYNMKNYYRIIYFSHFGDVAYSTDYGTMLIDENKDVSTLQWLEQASAQKGRVLFLAPHKDEWGIKRQEQVFSAVRKVQGAEFGYIEVQRSYKYLTDIFENVFLPIDAVVVLENGEYLYNSFPEAEAEEIIELCKEQKTKLIERVELSGTERLVYKTFVSEYGIELLFSQTTETVVADIEKALEVSVLMTIVTFLIFYVMIFIITGIITKPIRELTERMEATEIENLEEKTEIAGSTDELKTLVRAYIGMTERLSASIQREKEMTLLQFQAQFDVLQAQINPHFLYNVLNVLSNRGIMNNDEEICNICGSLAAMLRYSTGNITRYSTVAEELEYLQKYVHLLKSRYEHRLEVEISCEEEIKKEKIPKIVLQQLVENSVQHGFTNSSSVMKILVRGWRDEKGWFFEVSDNGQGILPEVKSGIDCNIDRIRQKILLKKGNIEMEIGGMGIVNTYARMFLLYETQTFFEMHNRENGLSIIVGVKTKGEL